MLAAVLTLVPVAAAAGALPPDVVPLPASVQFGGGNATLASEFAFTAASGSASTATLDAALARFTELLSGSEPAQRATAAAAASLLHSCDVHVRAPNHQPSLRPLLAVPGGRISDS